MDPEADEKKAKPRRKVPRKVSPKYLENAALFHLKRYACSAKQLEFVLMRKVRRSLEVHGGDIEEAAAWIDDLIARLERCGLLNDEAFARMKADSLRASGKSSRAIAVKLRLKGLSPDVITEQLQRVGAESTEEQAAMIHARRKRLGPFSKDPATRAERRDRDMAALARAGFSYAVAKKVIGGRVGDDESEW